MTLNTEGVKDLLLDPLAMATPIIALVIEQYGSEPFQEGSALWDPLVVYRELNADFDVYLTPQGENRYEAMHLALTTEAFYDDVRSWLAITSVLYEGSLQDLTLLELNDITIPEVLWSAYEVELVRGNMDDRGEPLNTEFSPRIQLLIDRIIDNEAEDPSTPDNPDRIVPYYIEFMDDQRTKLLEQLTRIGLPPQAPLPPLPEEI